MAAEADRPAPGGTRAGAAGKRGGELSVHLVTLKSPGGGRPGVILGAEILDVGAAAAAVPAAGLCPSSVRQIIAAGPEALDLLKRLVERVAGDKALADRLREAGGLVPREGAKLDAPIPDPGFILACGRNYRAHLEEFNAKIEVGFPSGFGKSVRAVIGPGEAIRLPRDHPDMVDWEAEFSAVIGKPCHGVSEAEAMDYVWGYTQVNDISARNWVGDPQNRTIMDHDRNLLGKQFPTFCPMGPAVVTADEVPDPHDVRVGLRLNGQVMQDGHTSKLIFNIPQLIAYYSQWYRLMPGDVVTTGSPAGVGMARKPPIFLKAGDLVEVETDAIGVLANPVAAA
ncbi:MAG: fumarylacetoacetate hydrolase [Phenylobacterium sp.]|nr:fumarylacetoacetate hydrolase [Phenylobacterium sp.]